MYPSNNLDPEPVINSGASSLQVILVCGFLLAVLLLIAIWIWAAVSRRRPFKRFTAALIETLDRDILLKVAQYHEHYAEGLERPLYAGDRLTREQAARVARHRNYAATLRRLASQ